MTSTDRILSITKLAVIESLRKCDGNTGEQLALDIAAGLAAKGVTLVIQVLRCSGADGFRQIMARLAEEAAGKEHHPMVHIECHGDDVAGLEFGDGSMLSWLELADLLRPINEATELGLIVSVATCFGIGAVSGVCVTKPAPCFALIGPSEGIWSNELYQALKSFYLDMMAQTSTSEAVRRLTDTRLESGGFVVLTVRQWFREVIMCYLQEMTSVKERKAQALRQHQKARAEGRNLGLTYWKQHYLRTMPALLRDYHRKFFMTDRFPQHAAHFGASLGDIDTELRARGLED